MSIRSAQQKQKWIKIDEDQGAGLYRSMLDPNLYQARLRNSERFIRRSFRAISPRRAMERLPEILGWAPKEEEPSLVEVGDAFELALKRSSRGEKSSQDWLYFVRRFMDWLAANHTGATHWGLLTRGMLWEYLDTYKDLSANTRRLALQPIVQTAGLMHREHGFINIAERLGIGSKLQAAPKIVYLEDVTAFCDWLAERDSWLEAGVALQGLSGLQLQEALRLTWRRVDLEEGLIEISGEVKNVYRNRVIPVVNRTLDALARADKRRAAVKRKVQPVEEAVLGRRTGEPYRDYWFYSQELRKAMREWNRKLGWAPKDLRNALPTFGTSEGMWNAVWEQYIGHAPGTVTTRHYVPRLASASGGERRALKRQMDLFRAQVVGPVNGALESREKAGDVQPLYSSEEANRLTSCTES